MDSRRSGGDNRKTKNRGSRPLQLSITPRIAREFAGEEVRDPRYPGVAGLANDQIVSCGIDPQIRSRVIDDQTQARVAQWLVIHVPEVA